MTIFKFSKGMFETSKSILENHIFLIQKYGFIPNGSRVIFILI